MQMYFESWKYMFLRRSLAQYKYILFLSVHLGVLPPPPQYQKAGYASDFKHRLYTMVDPGGAVRAPPPPPNLNDFVVVFAIRFCFILLQNIKV